MDSKISNLIALTTPAADDELAIVDTDAASTKKITHTNLLQGTMGGAITLGGNITASDKSITGLDTLTFTDVDGAIAGIANKNLVDKSATESITGTWTLSAAIINALTMGGNIVMGDNSITGIDTLTFTDTAGTVAGIANGNLLDKSATEVITGGWTLNALTLGGNIVAADNSITGIDTLTFTDVDGAIAGIANKNLVDKSAVETIAGVWDFSALPTTSAGNPSTDTQLARKAYVDAAKGAGIIWFGGGDGTFTTGVGGYIGKDGIFSAEGGVESIMPTSATIKNLYFEATANSLDGNCVITVRKNGSNQTLTCTLGATVLTCDDTAHTFTVVAGDVISILGVNSATGEMSGIKACVEIAF